MTLPSKAGDPVTAQVGFFNIDAASLAGWIRTGFDDRWIVRPAQVMAEREAIGLLAPSEEVSRYLCVPVGSWTAVLTNGPLGTDVGVLPSYAARELRCRALRAVNFDAAAEYPARLLEVFGPNGAAPLALERSISVAKDGGRWVFETFGEPYEFEDESAYVRVSKPDRFSGDMLYEYLSALGVPVDEVVEWAGAILVERPT